MRAFPPGIGACGFLFQEKAGDGMGNIAYGWAAAAVGACLAAAHGETPATRVRVIEGRVAIYASTNEAREAVGWVPAGTELAVCGELTDEGTWVRVEPPESVSVWIYRELVRDGVVTANKSRVRTGAGLNFRAIATLNRGERVEVRGSYGDWLRIRPPENLAVWVLRDQVEPLAEMPPEGLPEEEGTAPPAADSADPAVATPGPTNVPDRALAPVAPASNVPVPAALMGAALEDVPGQGLRALMTGILDWGGVGGFAAPFCLVAPQTDGGSQPVCHLVVPLALGAPLVGAPVVVEGTRWRLKGVEIPVIVVETLREGP